MPDADTVSNRERKTVRYASQRHTVSKTAIEPVSQTGRQPAGQSASQSQTQSGETQIFHEKSTTSFINHSSNPTPDTSQAQAVTDRATQPVTDSDRQREPVSTVSDTQPGHAVTPEPVLDTVIMSRPLSAMGQACACTAVGCAKEESSNRTIRASKRVLAKVRQGAGISSSETQHSESVSDNTVNDNTVRRIAQ